MQNVEIEPVSLDQWYAVATAGSLDDTRLLGTDIALRRSAGEWSVRAPAQGRALPVQERYGCVWTTLGRPNADLPSIPEAEEADRRVVVCGSVQVRSSGLRIVENFLDMAHFPFVHTGILGAEPTTEVASYASEIRRDVDEVWATECRFYQPQAALSASGGIETQYVYRVATPFVTLLYKTCPEQADRQDVICLFVQPMEPDRCRAHPVMFMLDAHSGHSDLVGFQQLIFLQDRIILENQRPRLLPLDPCTEIPTRADRSSIVYRRWLKEHGVTYGTTSGAGAAFAGDVRINQPAPSHG